MATCFDTPLHPSEPGSSPEAPLRGPCSAPRQAPVLTTIGFLHDTPSNRTFRIPDVPATSTILNIKHWYAKNITPGQQLDPRLLAVLHNGQPVSDATQVWQLAQGQGQFAVSVTPQQTSPRSVLTLFVDTSLPMPPIQLRLSSDSSILYTKQRLVEMLNLPMAIAASPATTLAFPPNSGQLLNEATLASCNIPDNAQLKLSVPQGPMFQPPMQQQLPMQQQPGAPKGPPQYARIAEIWQEESVSNSGHGPSNSVTTSSPGTPGSQQGHALLPSALFEDDEEIPTNVRPASTQATTNTNNSNKQNSNGGQGSRRGTRRSHSPPGDRLNSDQLQHLAANFRTKPCRNGHGCKFGRNCWFAHNAEELRKPTDPLPNNLPAVHKLERYSHREAKDRQAS